MGVINKTVASGLAGAAAGAAAVVTYVTSTTTLVAPIPKNDPLWASEHLQNLNCLQNPVMTEICTKRVPLSRIRAELRDDESALATAFSRAVWSGWGTFGNTVDTFVCLYPVLVKKGPKSSAADSVSSPPQPSRRSASS